MMQKQAIRWFTSGLLICIFSLSITPVFFVHTIFATHIDNKKSNPAKGPQLSVSGYNCNCEDFVAEAQFLNNVSVISITPLRTFSVFNKVEGNTFLRNIISFLNYVALL